MRAVFLGFQGWGLTSLRAMTEASVQPVLVVSHPDDFGGHTVAFTESISDFCDDQGLEYLIAETINPDVEAAIVARRPDLVLTSNWRRIIPASLVKSLSIGAVNVHRSLLPAYAGLSPLNWAIAMGEERVGVTVHEISDVVDGGAILGQAACEIAEHQTATDAYHETGKIIGSLLPSILEDVEGALRDASRQDRAKLNYFHLRGERERRIDWLQPAKRVVDLVRAQSEPFENAFFLRRTGDAAAPEKILVKQARLSSMRYQGTPGRVVERASRTGSVLVVAGEVLSPAATSVELISVAREGSGVAPAGEILKPGDYLL